MRKGKAAALCLRHQVAWNGKTLNACPITVLCWLVRVCRRGLITHWLKINATIRGMHSKVSIALQYLAFPQLCRIRHKNGVEPIPQQNPTFPSKNPESAVKSPIPDLGEFYPRDPPRTWDINETQRSYLAALDRERGRARESERERVDSAVGFIHSASIHRASEILFLL